MTDGQVMQYAQEKIINDYKISVGNLYVKRSLKRPK